MNLRIQLSILLLTVSQLFASAAFSKNAAWKDHSLVSGMPNYEIEGYELTQFGRLGISAFDCVGGCSEKTPGFKNGEFAPEGKVTRIVYLNNKNPVGPLGVLRNYENAIKSLGGRKISSREQPDGYHVFYVEKNNVKTWLLLDNEASTYVLSILEQGSLAQVVTAGQLSDSINKQGYATLRINFDTNKTVVKSEAKPAIDEVIALLKKDTALKLSVEGHTDNVGNASANKTLSQGRAQSVVQALVQGGIDAKRLEAKGFGNDAPIADNRTDDGKEKNRRVELVKIK